jgi:hypothetical protein
MVATLAPAGGDEGVKVRFTITHGLTPADFAGAYSADFSRCTFTALGEVVTPCVVPVTGNPEPIPGKFDDTLSGDVQGTGSFAGTGILGAANMLNVQPAPDFPYEAFEPLSVTVEGCGTGTFLLHNEGNLNSNAGQWWIVPGSGRGGLVGISGNGTFSAPGPVGSLEPDSDIGHIRCAKKNS